MSCARRAFGMDAWIAHSNNADATDPTMRVCQNLLRGFYGVSPKIRPTEV